MTRELLSHLEKRETNTAIKNPNHSYTHSHSALAGNVKVKKLDSPFPSPKKPDYAKYLKTKEGKEWLKSNLKPKDKRIETHLASILIGFTGKEKELKKSEKDKLLKKVFLKLAKCSRINKFEKMFRIEDRHINKVLPAWESKEPKEEEFIDPMKFENNYHFNA